MDVSKRALIGVLLSKGYKVAPREGNSNILDLAWDPVPFGMVDVNLSEDGVQVGLGLEVGYWYSVPVPEGWSVSGSIEQAMGIARKFVLAKEAMNASSDPVLLRCDAAEAAPAYSRAQLEGKIESQKVELEVAARVLAELNSLFGWGDAPMTDVARSIRKAVMDLQGPGQLDQDKQARNADPATEPTKDPLLLARWRAKDRVEAEIFEQALRMRQERDAACELLESLKAERKRDHELYQELLNALSRVSSLCGSGNEMDEAGPDAVVVGVEALRAERDVLREKLGLKPGTHRIKGPQCPYCYTPSFMTPQVSLRSGHFPNEFGGADDRHWTAHWLCGRCEARTPATLGYTAEDAISKAKHTAEEEV